MYKIVSVATEYVIAGKIRTLIIGMGTEKEKAETEYRKLLDVKGSRFTGNAKKVMIRAGMSFDETEDWYKEQTN